MLLIFLTIALVICYVLLVILLSIFFKSKRFIKSSLLVSLFLIFVSITLSLFFYIKETDYKFSLAKSVENIAPLATIEFTEPLQDFPFNVYQDGEHLKGVTSYAEAVEFAKLHERSEVHYIQSGSVVWSHIRKMPVKILLDVPLISQLPELPRGCEVTSLAMLLEYAGVSVNKTKLADEIIKDPSPFVRKNGVIHFGNPYKGFVGDMYNINNPGYGVYHDPIKKLAEQYLPQQMIDMTGAEFTDILYPLLKGRPVWVITNTKYSKLPESSFETWQTPDGPVKITYHEHSVVITGYDKDYIYFNDPLEFKKNRTAPIKSFFEAWEQMGSQAITYTY